MIIQQTWNELADEYFAIKNSLTYTPFKKIQFTPEQIKAIKNNTKQNFGNIISWTHNLDIEHLDLAFKLGDEYFFQWYAKNKIAKRYSKKQIQILINEYLPHKDYQHSLNYKKNSIIQDFVVIQFNKMIDFYNQRMKALIQYCPEISPEYNIE